VSIWKLLGLRRPNVEGAPGNSRAETLRQIVETLERLPEDRARSIAAFAYTLGRVANADLEISREETLAMERIVRGLGGLGEEEAVLVVQIAKAQNRLFGSTENFLVTREFGATSTHEQKLRLLQCLFAVSAADQTVSAVEDNEIRRIATELGLTHGDFIQARSAYRPYLSVFKKPDPPSG
jgi:uncharacterized tellurite resistance protein B-like protein